LKALAVLAGAFLCLGLFYAWGFFCAIGNLSENPTTLESACSGGVELPVGQVPLDCGMAVKSSQSGFDSD
jgi:hypothetical protein